MLLAGGGGGAKLALGLAQCSEQIDLCVVTNTGDDFRHLGLYIAPDTDSVLYALSGALDTNKGWGRGAETWNVLAELTRLEGDDWFQLGDKDLALHLIRSGALEAGHSLSKITADLASSLGIMNLRVIPATEQSLRTTLLTDSGSLAFQEYFVAQRCEPRVETISYEGALEARVSPSLIDWAKKGVDLVIMGPSNPYLSLYPILAIQGMDDFLMQADKIVAVSPLIDGQALKGPLAKLMTDWSIEPSASNWVKVWDERYPKLIDQWFVDEVDAHNTQFAHGEKVIQGLSLHMTDMTSKTRLGRAILERVFENA